MKSNAVADSIGSFVKSRYDSSMYLVAFLEVALWFRLLGSALLFQRGSWILMVVYTAFMRARFSQSQFVQTHLRQLVARVDGLLQNQGTPPIAQQIWSQVRMGSWKFAEATDLSRFIGSSKPAPAVTRKAQ